MLDTLTIARYVVFGVFALSALAALGSWLVKSRRVSPFGPLGRGLRAVTDPVVRPVERRLVRMGGNPVHAAWWLIVVVAVAGVIFLSLLGWVRYARWMRPVNALTDWLIKPIRRFVPPFGMLDISPLVALLVLWGLKSLLLAGLRA